LISKWQRRVLKDLSSRGTYDVKFEPKFLVSCFTVLRVRTMTVS
jgi:hypothetical protein